MTSAKKSFSVTAFVGESDMSTVVQNVVVTNLPTQYAQRLRYLRILKKIDNPGLFVYHRDHYDKTLYTRVYDELNDDWEILFLHRIIGVDVFGNEACGHVVHQQRDRGRTQLDRLHGFVVVDVGR